MTAHAEQQIIANAIQKEESLNVQQIVDKRTKDLKVGTTVSEGTSQDITCQIQTFPWCT